MSWFKREDHEIVNDSEKTVRTEGLWIRCPDCGKILFKAELEVNQQVCPHCGHHFRIDARTRIENLLNQAMSWSIWDCVPRTLSSLST